MATGYTQFLHVQKKQAHSEFLFIGLVSFPVSFYVAGFVRALLLDGTLYFVGPCALGGSHKYMYSIENYAPF